VCGTKATVNGKWKRVNFGIAPQVFMFYDNEDIIAPVLAIQY